MLAIIACITQSASAQKLKPIPDTVISRKPAYGFGLDEFLVAAVKAWRPASGQYRDHWDFARTLGVNVLEVRNDDPALVETLRDAADPARNERLMLDIYPTSLGPNGREVTFFPFDSAENYYYQNVFTYTAKSAGLATTNNLAIDPIHPPEEAIYAPNTVSAGAIVASNIAFGYRADWQTRRYPLYQWDPHVVDNRGFVVGEKPYSRAFSYTIVVTGHLFDPGNPNSGGGGANDSDSLLVVEVWNEVPKGSTYRLANGLHRAATDTEFVYATVNVLKQHFVPPIDPRTNQRNYNPYQFHEYTLTFDSAMSPTGMRYGPRHPDLSAHCFDIRVRYTGREKLALRSLTLRDLTAQLANGNDAASIAYRNDVVNFARRMIYGFNSTGAPDSTRVIRFNGGDEGAMFEHTGFTTLDTLLHHNFPLGQDSILKGMRAYRANAWHRYHIQQTFDDQPEIAVETYSKDVTNALWGDWGIPDSLGLNQTPQIARHNGGHYEIPLIDTTRESVENYEKLFQRAYVGAYITGDADAPYTNTWTHDLGTAAWASRRTGKRLIHWMGVHSALNIFWDWDTVVHHGWYRRYSQTHIHEPAEMRMMANLGLCYGSRGVEYSWVGSTLHDYPTQEGITSHPRWDTTLIPRRYYSDVGPVGETADSLGLVDYFPVLPVESLDHIMHDTLTNYWSGWGVRTAELRWLSNWLRRIGAATRHLQWNDAYSLHFTEHQAWMPDSASGNPLSHSRPLADSLIIRSVRAIAPNNIPDPPAETYVEMGFFDTRRGPTRIWDTNFVFLVNRRTFERSNDIARTGADSILARKLDNLAEVRTLLVTLRMKHPDTTQYNFIHIREVEPDTNRLPWMNAPREGLDTVVHGDSAFALTLRPGGGALLEFTYCKADDSLAIGDLRFGSQKKLVFDGRYWHATYHRPLTFWKPPQKTTKTTEDAVFYRRSLPVDSSLGAIRWDPRKQFEVLLSDTTNDTRSRENRFPSITVRSDSSKPGERVATVVWSCYGSSTSNGKREVLLRNVRINDEPFSPTRGPIEKVADYWGRLDTAWGTPVVSRLHGGYVIAWSDSLRGVLARFRQLDGSANWWSATGQYSTSDTVARTFTQAGQYPSMPPFAHVKGRDSSIAIVWEQPGGFGSSIQYARLVHSPDPNNPNVGRLGDMNRMRITPTSTAHFQHPSIDMTQDVWFGAQEGVAFESKELAWDVNSKMHNITRLHFASLWTETSRAWDPNRQWRDSNNVPHTGDHWRPYYDSIEGVWQWTFNSMQIADLPYMNYASIWPNTASLNNRIDSLHALERIYFSIAMSTIPNAVPMQQATAEYATSFLWSAPRAYLIGGHSPNMASSLTRQGTYEAAIYQALRDTASRMETTRQFFAKARPRGYMAYGRQVYFPILDTNAANGSETNGSETAISGALDDVWYAGDGGSGPLPLAVRPDALRRTDSLDMVRGLFRTGYFHAHDSTAIGCSLKGRFVGDTALASGMRVEFIAEVVDSANDRVVAVLDSFAIAPDGMPDGTPGLDSHAVECAPVLDLLSGTYYVRMRIEPVGVIVEDLPHAPRYPVEELARYVEDDHLGKLRRLNGLAASQSASQGRITAQPNPVPGATELRFSVPSRSSVTITVFDRAGREVARLLDGEMMEEGRYAFELNAANLPPGSYLVELRYGAKRSVEKIVVVR